MKLQELRQIIREEISKTLKESTFKDSLNEEKSYKYDFDFFKKHLKKTVRITWKNGNSEDYIIDNIYGYKKHTGSKEIMLVNVKTKKAFSNRISTLNSKIENIEI